MGCAGNGLSDMRTYVKAYIFAAYIGYPLVFILAIAGAWNQHPYGSAVIIGLLALGMMPLFVVRCAKCQVRVLDWPYIQGKKFPQKNFDICPNCQGDPFTPDTPVMDREERK